MVVSKREFKKAQKITEKYIKELLGCRDSYYMVSGNSLVLPTPIYTLFSKDRTVICQCFDKDSANRILKLLQREEING